MKPRAYPEDITCVVQSTEQKGSIYVGNLQASQNLLTLKKHKIKSVLTSCSGVFLCHPKSEIPYYLYVPGQDHQTFDLSRYFNQAALFVKESVDKTNIMVHCMAGISRSVALVIAYLIKYKQMTTQDALALIKDKRNIAQPNKGFISQLKKFEGQLRLTKIKMQSIFSTSCPVTEKVQSNRESKNGYKYSNCESMNKSVLIQNSTSISRYQDSSLKNSRRNSIQPKYTYESIQPMDSSKLRKNLDEINIEIDSIKKSGYSQIKSGYSQKKNGESYKTTPTKNSMKSRNLSMQDPQKPKKKVRFNLNPQYFEIQPSQQIKEIAKRDYSRQGKYQYTRVLEAQRTYTGQKINIKTDKYTDIRTSTFQQQKTRDANEYKYTTYSKPYPEQMSQIDKRIQAITKKYDQHLFQTNKRALTNNYLNTTPESQMGKKLLNYSSERQKMEQIKTPKFSDLDRKSQFQKKQKMYGSAVHQERRNSDLGFQSKNRTTDQNLLSGNRTIDRILERKSKQGDPGSIRRNSNRYATTINYNY